MTENAKPPPPKTFSELMFHPDRALFEEELDMVLTRMKQRGVDQEILADVMFERVRTWMLPPDNMNALQAQSWMNRMALL